MKGHGLITAPHIPGCIHYLFNIGQKVRENCVTFIHFFFNNIAKPASLKYHDFKILC